MSGLSSLFSLLKTSSLQRRIRRPKSPSPAPSRPSSLEDFSAVCKPVDGRSITGFFSRYPAGISVEADRITKALLDIGCEASEPDSPERRRAKVRQSNPLGDPFAICHCSAYPDRLELVACIIEIMWIHDGKSFHTGNAL